MIDARDYQILFLGSFLFLGIANRDWTLHPQAIIVLVVTCWLTQLVCLYARGELFSEDNSLNLSSLKSATITALGLSLLLRADRLTTIIIAAGLAIASKFILQWQDKHFFNPANFGIIATIILTQDAWVSPGQWGDEWWYALLFFGTGGIVLKKVGRWDTTAAFLLGYGGLEGVRNIWLGWTWDVYFHRLTSGSLLLFALFMITDPRSIPNAKSARLIWSLAIALVTFILRNFFFIHSSVFWALFIVSPITVVLDIYLRDRQFSWQDSQTNSETQILA